MLGPLVALSCLPAPADARDADAIVVSAMASRDYVRPLGGDGRPEAESYVFMEGQRMGSGTADAGQSKVNFEQIARVLAGNLAKQNYFPAREADGAQVLIRVFWGTTLIYEDPQQQLNTEALNAALAEYTANTMANGLADSGPVNMTLNEQATGRNAAASAVNRNAALLGYQRSLDRLGRKATMTAEEISLRGELTEERYFVVLVAYDYQFLRQHKKPRLLWITGLSIRSPGNNFPEALPALALAGAGSYGRDFDDIQRVKIGSQGGSVKMPEMEILESGAPGKK